MVTEQEAREAAGRMQWLKTTQHSHDIAVLATFAVQELARRDAEREERAKPIDAEWFHVVTRGNRHILRWNDETGDVDLRPMTTVRNVKIRGQLLYLLRALKGGA